MHRPPQAKRARLSCRRSFALAALLFLAGCVNHDFGQINPSLTSDSMHDWVSLDGIAGQHTLPSSFELTDDERLLRDLAYPLIEAPYNRQKWYSLASETGAIGGDHRAVFDRSAYAKNLLGSRYRSPSARYARLIDDIRNDTTNMPQFFETAGRVLDIDEKRRRSLSFIGDVAPNNRANAYRRIRENASIVALVRAKLAQHAAGYRFALERLVVITPSQQAVETERALNQMQATLARYRGRSAPTWVRERSLASSN
jgi:hypothetical protein